MKKLVLGSALSVASLGPALAQTTITLYGLIDAGVTRVTNINGEAVSDTLVASNLAVSRWGIRGTEDLGGGTSAFFNLEAGFDPSTGEPAVDPSYSWQRRSVVGLSSKQWGEVRLGREVAPIFWAILPISDRPSAGSASTNSLGANVYNGPGPAGRFSNAVIYVTPQFYGLTASMALAETGEGAERPKSAYLIYRSKDFTAAAAWMKISAVGPLGQVVAGNAERESWLAGVKYRGVKNWEFYGGYQDATQTTLAGLKNVDFSLIWLGANYQLTPAWTLKTSAYLRNDRGSDNGANLYSVSAEYNLSKRTLLYTKFDRVNNKGTSNLGVAQNALTIAGENQNQLSIGILHQF